MRLLVLVFSFSFVLLTGCGDPPTEYEKDVKACKDRYMHNVYAEDFVKERLKSPSTALFVPRSAAAHTRKGPCTYRTIGLVDSQNSFGGTVRSAFDITVRYDKEKNVYHVVSLIIE